jgi:predicted nuclease of predicted toxin-antitoxin system
MKLLLDQGLPRSTVLELQKYSIEAIHVGEIGMASASDEEILEKAANLKATVVTLDSDFHAILASLQIKNTSVIRIRIEGLKASALAQILVTIISSAKSEIVEGSAVSVTDKGIRIHKLPLV